MKRSLGQNFLVDQGYLSMIAEAATGDNRYQAILELAAGSGNLTEHLLSCTDRLVAVEIDDYWSKQLQIRFSNHPNIIICKADARKLDLGGFFEDCSEKAVLVGNLPYNAASPIMMRFSKYKTCFSSFTILVQQEVAQRITSKPGQKDYSVLSVMMGLDFIAEILFDVPATAFRPSPKVVSSLVRLIPRYLTNDDFERPVFGSVVKAAFANRRKTVLNSLTNSNLFKIDKKTWQGILQKADILGDRRAETLSIKEYIQLSAQISLTLQQHKSL